MEQIAAPGRGVLWAPRKDPLPLPPIWPRNWGERPVWDPPPKVPPDRDKDPKPIRLPVGTKTVACKRFYDKEEWLDIVYSGLEISVYSETCKDRNGVLGYKICFEANGVQHYYVMMRHWVRYRPKEDCGSHDKMWDEVKGGPYSRDVVHGRRPWCGPWKRVKASVRRSDAWIDRTIDATIKKLKEEGTWKGRSPHSYVNYTRVPHPKPLPPTAGPVGKTYYRSCGTITFE